MENEESVPEFDPFAEAEAKPARSSGGGRLLGGLALIVALAVAGWNGWLWWQAQQEADTAVDVEAQLAQLRTAQATLEQSQQAQARRIDAVERLELAAGLAQLDQAVEQARSVAGSDRARLEGLEESIDETGERLDAVEGRLAAIVVRGESPRQGLDLAEVDYLLRSANERLRLYGDVRTADQALALADEQLAAMDDPVYLSVRQSIAGARLSLEDVEVPDTITLTEGLGQLQAQIPGLPFPGEVAVEQEDGAPDTAEDPGVWARFKAAVGGLVSVRRRADDNSLVSLEDKDYVRQGLWLQLESARLALLRDDDAAWKSALTRASATLEQYFDPDAARVTRFADGLERAAAVSLTVNWPDVSEPWTRLQGIRSVDPAATRSQASTEAARPTLVREAVQEADPEPSPVAATMPAPSGAEAESGDGQPAVEPVGEEAPAEPESEDDSDGAGGDG